MAKKLDSILEVLRSEAYLEDLPLQTDRIHVANGTLYLDGTFTENKEYCRNRLTVTYIPDTPAPERWLSFLHELLDAEDIPTLQEYMQEHHLQADPRERSALSADRIGHPDPEE